MNTETNAYHLAASVISDTIYTSENNGVTWISQKSGLNNWFNITGCSDGTKLIAAGGFDYLYTSNDKGVTWNRLDTIQNIWFGLAASSDASTIYAGGLIYLFKSIDGGKTWFPIYAVVENVIWLSIACSSDGQTVIAAGLSFTAEKPSILYVSLDGGLSWTEILVDSNANWQSVSCSSNGRLMYAADSNTDGSIWAITITKGNNIQTKRLMDPSSTYWAKVDCSSDGSSIIAASVAVSTAPRISSHVEEQFPEIIQPQHVINYLRNNSIEGKSLDMIKKEVHSTPAPRSNVTVTNGVYVSTDYGLNWKLALNTVTDVDPGWYTVSSSAGGDFLVYSIIGFNVYTSSDYGNNWVLQEGGGDKAWTRIFVTSEPVCVIGDTRILMGDGTFKKIKHIVRGDEVVTDKEKNTIKKVANVVSSYYDGYIVKIPKGSLGNSRSIYLSHGHPVWINHNRNRIYSKYLRGIEKLQIHQLLYNIQFEEEGSFYAENVRLDSLSPNFYRNKMKKELYFDQNKYDETLMIKEEDDPRRGKPKMI